jgi:hypothetical protein
VHLVEILIDKRVSCEFIDTKGAENVIFCRPLEESLDNVAVVTTKNNEFIHNFITESTGDSYLTTSIKLPDGEIFNNVKFKLVVCESGELPSSTIDTSVFGLPSDFEEVVQSTALLNEDVLTPESIVEQEEVNHPEYVRGSFDPIIIEQAKALEVKLNKQQQELKVKEEQLKRRQSVVEVNEKLQKTLENYKSELLTEYYNVHDKQKDILSSQLNDVSTSLFKYLGEKLKDQEGNNKEVLKELSNNNLTQLQSKQDLAIEALKVDINNLLSEKVKENSDNVDKLLIERTGELQQLFSEKLVLELEAHKHDIEEEIESINFTIDGLVEEKLKAITEEADKQLVNRAGNLQTEFANKLETDLTSHKTNLFDEFKSVSSETATTLFSEKTEELTTALNVLLDEHKQNLDNTVTKKINEVSVSINTFKSEVDGKLPKLDETIKEINKKLQTLVIEKKNVQLVVDDARKYTDTKVAQVSEEVMKYARRILDLGGGGGSNAVQYANGGTMNGNLNVTGKYLSGGVDLSTIFSGGGGGQGNPAVNALVISSSANWNSAYVSTTALNLSSSKWNESYTLLQSSSATFVSPLVKSCFRNQYNGNYTVWQGGIESLTNNSSIYSGYCRNNSLYSTIAGGCKNNIGNPYSDCNHSPSYSFIGGGCLNNIIDSVNAATGETGFSSIVGGSNNSINLCSSSPCGYNLIGGGRNNNILAGNHNVLGGGGCNVTNSSYTFIGGGYCNTINSSSGYCSVITGGIGNIIGTGFQSGCVSFIGGGTGNINGGNNSVITGGSNNAIYCCVINNDQFANPVGLTNVNNNTIGGGANNIIQSTGSAYYTEYDCFFANSNANNSSILGGYSNIIQDCNSVYNTTTCSNYNTIVGGSTNCINHNSSNNLIGGGCNNRIYGCYNTIVGGQNNSLSGTNNFTLGSNISVSANNYTFVNNLSSQGIVAAQGGNSTNWNTAYGSTTALNLSSNNWNTAYTVATTYQNASGSFITAVSGTANQINASKTGSTVTLSLPSNAVLPGNVTILGNLSAQGTATFANTVFTTTSALSAVANSSGPALYIGQSGSGDLASFYDLSPTPVEVLHVGASVGIPGVGIYTSTPNKELTVVGEISATKTIYASGGNSNNWNSVYSLVNTTTATTFNVNNLITTGSVGIKQTPVYFDVDVASVGNSYGDLGLGSSNNIIINPNSNLILTQNIGSVGIGTSAPNQKLTVVGNISGTAVIYASGGNSNNWNSVYTTVTTNSATTWNYQGTDLKALSSNWQSTYSTVSSLSANWNTSYSSITALNTTFAKLSSQPYTYISSNSSVKLTTGNNTISACSSYILGGNDNFIYDNCAKGIAGCTTSCNTIIIGGTKNKICTTASGYYNVDTFAGSTNIYSTIVNGLSNVIVTTNSNIYSTINGTPYSFIGNGISNTIGGDGVNISHGLIGNGCANTIINGSYGSILNGQNNVLCSNYGSILGGANNTNCYNNSFILGSNLKSGCANYTYVNNLSTNGNICASLICGNFYGNGANLTGIAQNIYSCSGYGNGSIVGNASLYAVGSVPNSVSQSGYGNLISGGYSNKISSECCQLTIHNSSIIGGASNNVCTKNGGNSTRYNNIVSGEGNTICASTTYSGYYYYVGDNGPYWCGASTVAYKNTIISGQGNTIFVTNSAINTSTDSYFNTILNGCTNSIIARNTTSGCFDLIGGGCNNTVYGCYNTILNGSNNSLSGSNNFTLGSNISVSANNFTFVNNLSSQGIVATANLTINKAPQTFVNPVTASGTFLVVNVNGTNQAIQLWNYSS